jgi:hypothetical protein
VLLGAFVALVAVLVSFGAAMPAYARLLGLAGPHVHACDCEARAGHSRHAQCACPLCFPELNDVDTYGAPSMTGRCGNDDPGWRTLSAPAVPTSDFVLVAPLARIELPLAPPISPSQWAERPELPPPRA